MQPDAAQGRMTLGRAWQAVGVVASIALLTFSAAAFSATFTKYTYDAMGRLTKVVYSDGHTITTTVTYTYDAAGNRRVVSKVRS
jgi:uncharacterized protein RhaS with RHS repeats